MHDTKQSVFNFWFVENQPVQWFNNSAGFISEIQDRFRLTYDMAADGLCHDWASDAAGAVALCIVLDQFPRRLFAGTSQAYATDETALLIAKQAIQKGFDQVLPHEQRFFLYLPFEHSETLHDQKRNIELFKSMERENPIALNTAQRHFDIFQKFGRFPWRNAALGRDNTPEEETFLKTHISGACA